MSTTLIQIKSFLGKYYPELLYSATQDKYQRSNLDTFFEQRFYIQNNKTQMIVDPGLPGLAVIIMGNEIHISKELYDHKNVVITNSLENKENKNPRSLYNPETFSTIAYLVCQNHTMFSINGPVDEPIYVKYRTDYETFYNSVLVFNLGEDLDAEIVEEVESQCALNAVVNYILQPRARLALSTFYKNNSSAISFNYRNVITQENSSYTHAMFGRGASNVIDENRFQVHSDSNIELLGVTDCAGRNFNSIVSLYPASENYDFSVNYRNIIYGKGNVTFTPSIYGSILSDASVNVQDLQLDSFTNAEKLAKIKDFTQDVVDRAVLERLVGVKRFYDNKTKFLQFP